MAKVTVPAMELTAVRGSGAPATCRMTAWLTLSVTADGVRQGTASFLVEADAEQGDGTLQIEAQTFSFSVGKGKVLKAEAALDAEFHNPGPSSYARARNVGAGVTSAQVVYRSMKTIFGANGFIVASDSENYAYFLTDAQGVLHAACKAGGQNIFQ